MDGLQLRRRLAAAARALRQPLPDPLKVLPRTDAREWRTWEHRFWGDSITLFSRHVESGPDGRTQPVFTGHTTPKPTEGDIILYRNGGGPIERYVVVKMKTFFDPPDQWFATCEEA